MLDNVKKELKKVFGKLHGQRKPLAKAHALFYKGLEEVDGNESKINVVYGKFR